MTLLANRSPLTNYPPCKSVILCMYNKAAKQFYHTVTLKNKFKVERIYYRAQVIARHRINAVQFKNVLIHSRYFFYRPPFIFQQGTKMLPRILISHFKSKRLVKLNIFVRLCFILKRDVAEQA